MDAKQWAFDFQKCAVDDMKRGFWSELCYGIHCLPSHEKVEECNTLLYCNKRTREIMCTPNSGQEEEYRDAAKSPHQHISHILYGGLSDLKYTLFSSLSLTMPLRFTSVF